GGRVEVDRDVQVPAFGEGSPNRGVCVALGRADVERDPVRADGIGRQQRTVQDEMRAESEEGPVLGAERLTLRSVDEDDRPATRLTRDRAPFPADREARPAPAQQPARLEGRDRRGRGGTGRTGSEPGAMVGEGLGSGPRGRTGEQARFHHWFRHAGSTATGSAVAPVTAASRLRFVPPDVSRWTRAALTATMHVPWTASIQSDHESLPAVNVCSTASGHAAYDAQWMARQTWWPIRSRSRLVTMTARTR